LVVKNLIVINERKQQKKKTKETREITEKSHRSRTEVAEMVATELILGMEELVNHIRELEAKNKKLEEENKDLKCSLAGAREVRKRLDYAIKKLEAKNKKLEEENKKLKEPMVEELEDYLEMNGAEGGIIKTQHERDFYKKKVVELKGERDFFESEFHKTLQHQADETEHYEEENKKLEGEIKRLKEEQEYQPKGSRIDPEGLHDYMKEEIDKLKEENKKLKEKSDEEEEQISYEYEVMSPDDFFDELDKLFPNNDGYIAHLVNIKKLEEENKKLKVEKEKEEMNVKILCKFLGGNSDEWFAVEEILKGFYSEDFIEANRETWSQFGLFEEDSYEEPDSP